MSTTTGSLLHWTRITTGGATLTVPPCTERQGGSIVVSMPTLTDSTPTLKKLAGNALYGIAGKTRAYL